MSDLSLTILPETPDESEEVEEEIVVIPPPPVEAAAKTSWLARLRSGLSKTSSNLSTLFVGVKIDEDLYEELEAALLTHRAVSEAAIR